MNSERDATRIVRTWLESGSTAIPDRVVDAVLAELPSRRQRRPRWSSWRTLTMKPIIPLAAGAAVIVLAVALGAQFLPGNPSIGGPTSSPSASPTPAFVGGQFVFAGDAPVNIDALSDGSSLSGTVEGEWAGKPFSIRLECQRQFDAQTWMFAGVLTQSATPDRTAGDWGAVIVRDGSPQQAGIYTEGSSTGDDCEGFVSGIPDFAVEGQDMIGPMDEGSITLP
jgi:energy-converting hydrogenase Eha subunit A